MKTTTQNTTLQGKHQTNTKSIVMTAFFAAIIFIGIQAFRIPMPAAVGTPFLHFGHIFVMLAILMLGPVRSSISGVIGLVVFDILNGYAHAIPNVFVSTIIKWALSFWHSKSLPKMPVRNIYLPSSAQQSMALPILSWTFSGPSVN